MTVTIQETCKCGATFEITGDHVSAALHAGAFRSAHMPCRRRRDRVNARAEHRREIKTQSDAIWHPNGRWVEIKCFWTWPFGHEYTCRNYNMSVGHPLEDTRCVGCNKKADPYGGLA